MFSRSLSLSADGTRLAASALGADSQPGSLQVFDFDGASDWMQVGKTLLGDSERDNFGISMALSSDGNTLAVGSSGYSNEESGIGVGRATTYRFQGGDQMDWELLGQPIDGSAKFDSFGASVALSSDGNTVAIGGPDNDAFGENAGHVKVMTFDGMVWSPVGSELGEPVVGGQLGFSIALTANGTRIACAAPFAIFDGFRNDVGQVIVYEANDEG